MATKPKDAPSTEKEAELVPPLTLRVLHSGESGAEGVPDVEPDQAKTNGASAAEIQRDVRAGGAATAFEQDLAAASDRIVAVNLKVLQALLTNAEANLEFLAALPSVRSFSDLLALQSTLARKQVDAMVGPTTEIGAITEKTMANAVDAMRNRITSFVRN